MSTARRVVEIEISEGAEKQWAPVGTMERRGRGSRGDSMRRHRRDEPKFITENLEILVMGSWTVKEIKIMIVIKHHLIHE